jgi:hypothetical protein
MHMNKVNVFSYKLHLQSRQTYITPICSLRHRLHPTTTRLHHHASMATFTWRTLAPLFPATALTIGGFYPFFTAPPAMREFGLPESTIAAGPHAHNLFLLHGGHCTVHGLAMWITFLRGDLRGLDILTALLIGDALTQSYVCYLEGSQQGAWFRLTTGVAISFWGFLGITRGRSVFVA